MKAIQEREGIAYRPGGTQPPIGKLPEEDYLPDCAVTLAANGEKIGIESQYCCKTGETEADLYVHLEHLLQKLSSVLPNATCQQDQPARSGESIYSGLSLCGNTQDSLTFRYAIRNNGTDCACTGPAMSPRNLPAVTHWGEVYVNLPSALAAVADGRLAGSGLAVGVVAGGVAFASQDFNI